LGEDIIISSLGSGKIIAKNFTGNDADSPQFVDEEQDLYSCRPLRDKKY
jgi:hypothetical protein